MTSSPPSPLTVSMSRASASPPTRVAVRDVAGDRELIVRPVPVTVTSSVALSPAEVRSRCEVEIDRGDSRAGEIADRDPIGAGPREHVDALDPGRCRAPRTAMSRVNRARAPLAVSVSFSPAALPSKRGGRAACRPRRCRCRHQGSNAPMSSPSPRSMTSSPKPPSATSKPGPPRSTSVPLLPHERVRPGAAVERDADPWRDRVLQNDRVAAVGAEHREPIVERGGVLDVQLDRPEDLDDVVHRRHADRLAGRAALERDLIASAVRDPGIGVDAHDAGAARGCRRRSDRRRRPRSPRRSRSRRRRPARARCRA